MAARIIDKVDNVVSRANGIIELPQGVLYIDANNGAVIDWVQNEDAAPNVRAQALYVCQVTKKGY